MQKKYDRLIIDVVNLCYKTFEKEKDPVVAIGSKLVYKNSICNFIRSVESLVKDYLDSDGEVYLLFDNYFSRADLKTSFMFADRRDFDKAYKETRKKEHKEFYNSVNFLRYYYLTDTPKFRSIQIQGLEADDLVKPLLPSKYCKGKTCLLVSSDLDWVRYLNNNPSVEWLPSFKEEPKTLEDVSLKLGFKVSENSIILYKTIFGDASDNIDSLVPLNEKNKEEFINLVKDCAVPLDMVLKARANPNCAILEAINKDEKQFTINMQLVSSIECDSSHIDGNILIGNESTTTHKIIREAMGLDESDKGFVFGNVKRPRC